MKAISCDDETKCVKFYVIEENNFLLIVSRDYYSKLKIFRHKLKSVLK